MAGGKDDKQPTTRLNDMIAGRPNALVGQVPGRKRRTEDGEDGSETDEDAVETANEQDKANGLYANASPFASFAEKNRPTEAAPAQDAEADGATGEPTDD